LNVSSRTATPREAFAALADMAGLKVEFDPGVASSPAATLLLNIVDILDALDMLSLQTRHFLQVIDEHTIRVLPDTQAVRMQRELRETRTFVPAESSEDALAEMLNVLRVVFSLRETKIENNSIVVRDTLENLALVQRAIDILGKPAVSN
jgi:hypothetical protein